MESWEIYDNESKRQYQQWKKSQVITNVEILPDTLLISTKEVLLLQHAINNSILFVLICLDKIVTVDVSTLSIMQDSKITYFDTIKQLENIIKLLLLSCTKVIVPHKKKVKLLKQK